MAGWGPEHCVPADIIRQLLLGRVVTDPDPRGLRLRGARIQGVLDLEQLVTDVSLELADCLIEDGIRAHDARLRGLWLHRCRVNSVTGPAFGGCRLQVGTLMSFAYSVVTASSRHGALQLMGARIDGELSLSSATLTNTGGAALAADGLQTAGDLFLNEGFTARGAGDHAVGLAGAVIGGVLDCSDARLVNTEGAALSADRLNTLAAVRLDRLSAVGAVRLSDTRFGGRLACQAVVRVGFEWSCPDIGAGAGQRKGVSQPRVRRGRIW